MLRLIIILTFLMEAITCFFRFGLGKQSTRDTRFLAKITFGLRIHHGYVGIILIVLAISFQEKSKLRQIILILGISLLLSDFIHHFLILWPITGNPQFDFFYK